MTRSEVGDEKAAMRRFELQWAGDASGFEALRLAT